MDEPNVVPYPTVMGSNNRDQSVLSDPIIHKNQNFLSEQFREADTETGEKQKKKTREITIVMTKNFFHIKS